MSADPVPPRARVAALAIEELGDELLIYDLERDHAHCLSPEVAHVWRACDGTRSPERIAVEGGLDLLVVKQALDELAGCALLVSDPRVSRRQLTVGLARGAAVTAVAVPLIRSIVAPTPADAATAHCTIGLRSGSSCAVACPGCTTCILQVLGLYLCGL